MKKPDRRRARIAAEDTKDKISVGFISLGCAKNLVDSQVMAGALLKEGIVLAASPESADVIIVNTCSFIADARNESEGAIVEACMLKRAGACRAVVVAGCLPQRYRDVIRGQYPEVDAFIGLDEIAGIGRIIREIEAGGKGVDLIGERSIALFDPPVPGLVFTGGPYAYLKIAEGCNHACSFCAIPSIRGRYRSRLPSNILSEAEALLAAGIKELAIIAQDTTRYGDDLDGNIDLAYLLRELGRLGGKFRIRLLYGFPDRITDGLLATMAGTPQVCHYLDVPVQHSHAGILKAMRRGATAKHVAGLAGRIRRFMPDAAIRTTCITGFPGEREEHFRHLLDYIAHSRFDHLGVFVFSPEAGTSAFALKGRPSSATAERRRDAIMLEQKKIVDDKLAMMIGKTLEVLVDGPAPGGKGEWIARAAGMAPEVDGHVILGGAAPGTGPGAFMDVRITGQAGYDLIARPVSKAGRKMGK